MEQAQTIHSQDIRNALLARAKAYAEAHKSSFSAIGMAAVGDSKFLWRLDSGKSFNISTYQKVVDWLDAQKGETAQ
jgi:hypothetical protein